MLFEPFFEEDDKRNINLQLYLIIGLDSAFL